MMIPICRICGHGFASHSWSGQCSGEKPFGRMVCKCAGYKPRTLRTCWNVWAPAGSCPLPMFVTICILLGVIEQPKEAAP